MHTAHPGQSATRTDSLEHPPALFDRRYIAAFVIVTSLFFLWAIPNNLNDVLIRQFMKSFAISRFRAGLVQSAFYLGYFLFSMPAAMSIRTFGYKRGLAIGLSVYALGCFLFYPAAQASSYPAFLSALFVIAAGLAFLETGANSFIATLGAPGSSERRLNFSQAFNPLGAITGALVGTLFIFSGTELTPAQVAAEVQAGTYQAYLHREMIRVINPYLALGCCAIGIAFVLSMVRFPSQTKPTGSSASKKSGSLSDVLRRRHLVLAVLAQFFYVGAQVGTWSYFISYVQDYAHQPEKVAGMFLTGTLAAFGAGRFSATVLMRYVRPNQLMALYSGINVLLLAAAILRPGWSGVWCIFLTSFFMSLMFPTIFALGVKDLGAATGLGGSMIVMAIIGGAVFTPVMGWIAEARHSMAEAMLVPLVCYVFIIWYSIWGSEPKEISTTQSAPTGRKVTAMPSGTNLE